MGQVRVQLYTPLHACAACAPASVHEVALLHSNEALGDPSEEGYVPVWKYSLDGLDVKHRLHV